MSPRLHRAWWVGLLGLAACQDPPDITGEINDYADVVSETNGVVCACPQNAGFNTIAECNDTLGTLGSQARQCIAGALDGHEDAGRDHLVCVTAAYETYRDCLEVNVSCDAGVYDDCTEDRDAAIAACPQLASDVGSNFDACTP